MNHAGQRPIIKQLSSHESCAPSVSENDELVQPLKRHRGITQVGMPAKGQASEVWSLPQGSQAQMCPEEHPSASSLTSSFHKVH